MIHATPDSIVGQMIQNGHHKHGTIETLPADRHCEACGARTESEEALMVCPKAEYVSVGVLNREIKLVVNTFGKVKSGKKLQRKVSKLYGKEMRKVVEQRADALYKSFEEHIKPRPNWMPERLWRWIGSKFIEGI